LRRKANKKEWLQLLEKLGLATCFHCGYDRCFAAIDFHHRDPTKKDFEIGRFLYEKITEKRLAELLKVVPLCCRCHREVHEGLWKI
jgi:hypothetical protein